MIAIGTDYISIIEALPPDAMTIFRNIAWDEYKTIVKELGHAPRIRMAYDKGILQIMTTSPKHERIAAMFGWLVLEISKELRQHLESIRSATLMNEAVRKGTEADDCFYIQHASQVVGKDIDFDIDPPPDLAIEVNITSPSLKKFPIYAALGVPEIWKYKRGRTRFYQLVDSDYQEISHSLAFPFLTPDAITEYVHKGLEKGQVPTLLEFADWVRANKSNT
jgi:Uma2 family endonuclease